MHAIDSYEVLEASASGELLLSTNFETGLEYGDGEVLAARFRGLDLQVEAPTPFLIEDLPENATEYLCEHGQIRFLEFGDEAIDRMVTLMLIG